MKCVKKDSYVEKSYHLLSDFIDQISVKYQIEMENKDNLIWHLHNTAHLYRQELFTEFILFDQKEYNQELSKYFSKICFRYKKRAFSLFRDS